jgi:hypothetical protein
MSREEKPPAFAPGELVRIADAQPGTPDPKGLVYYEYFRGLAGNVVKAYPDGSVAIAVNRKTLPAEIRTRHEASEIFHRDKWIASLSEEDRNRLTERDKKFKLRYTILVAAKHVVPENSTVLTDKGRPTLADIEAAEQAHLDTLDL